jgi:uncharacterized protein (DUF934 family)
MRQLLKQREVVADTWKYVDEDPQADAVIIPFARFQAERDQWLASGKKLGVRLAPADQLETLAKDLPRLSLIACEFAGISEGRGYTHAQLLRKRYNFQGEIRAVGKILRDQLFYMARCGFDVFEFPDGADLNVALTAFRDFSVAYQPAADRGVDLKRRQLA